MTPLMIRKYLHVEWNRKLRLHHGDRASPEPFLQLLSQTSARKAPVALLSTSIFLLSKPKTVVTQSKHGRGKESPFLPPYLLPRSYPSWFWSQIAVHAVSGWVAQHFSSPGPPLGAAWCRNSRRPVSGELCFSSIVFSALSCFTVCTVV